MAYDSSKDRKIRTIGTIKGEAETTIEVAVFSYGGGPEKIGLNRCLPDGKPVKLSRLTFAEAKALKEVLP